MAILFLGGMIVMEGNNGKATASLVLGIVSLLTIFLGQFSFVGIILAIVGLVLGINARKEEPTNMATAGVVLCIVALVLDSLVFLACVACVGGFALLNLF
jgi:hypothetical protein